MIKHLLLIMALAVGQAIADDEVRKTTVLNTGVPTIQEVDAALFPKEIAKLKEECVQMEKIGLRCQGVIPKSSLDTIQVTFARGSSELSNEGKDFLRAVGSALQRKNGMWTSIVIEGHTDATGSSLVNQRLSQARAEEAKKFLVSEFKLNNIEAVGRASSRLREVDDPTSSNNRRIEFVPNW